MAGIDIYRTVVRPMLFRMDPEDAHHLMLSMAPMASALSPLLRATFIYKNSNLETTLAGVTLQNPVGLAGGFDKNGHLVSVLGHFGFGYAEAGSVTAQAKEGNPRPRLFRLPDDEAVINRMGLNGDGAEVVAARLKAAKFSLPIGINIAKTNDPTIVGDLAIEDQVTTFKAVKDLPITHVTINASCPNTKSGVIQQKSELDSLLKEIGKINSGGRPIFIKVSPDSSQTLLADLVELAESHSLAGFVAGNTSLLRDNLKTAKAQLEGIGQGGLSGPPIREKALNVVRRLHKLTGGKRQIIGCGGISTGQDAYQFIKAGACALQLYTALVYHGPDLPGHICWELSEILTSRGETVKEIIGSESSTKVRA